MVVVPTGKIDFGPACAAVPASASAPVAKMVLRSTLLIGVLLVLPSLLVRPYLQRFLREVDIFARCCVAIAPKKKARVAAGLRMSESSEASVLDIRRQLAAIGGQL